MAEANPDITVSDIISDVEVRLGDTNLDTTDYLPWISHAYQKLYHAIVSAGARAQEEFFGASTTFNLSANTNAYSLETNIPQFGGFIRVEVKYGATGDEWRKASRMTSVAYGRNQDELTSTYTDKTLPLYRKLGDSLIIIPAPPGDDPNTAQATVWYTKRPQRLTEAADVIDIPYRYIYPIANYTHAKAIIAENEDFAQSGAVEQKFDIELREITSLVVNEFSEYDGTNRIVNTNPNMFNNPLR